MTAPDGPRRRMSDVRYRLMIAAALVGAGVALFAAIQATNTSDEPPAGTSPPDVVEHLLPARGDEVLRQTEIGIDLAPGYEATLIVNGEPIPDDELRRVPEQNQVFFLPREGTVVPELPGGRNCVTALVWRSAVGRGVDDQTFSWCFQAT